MKVLMISIDKGLLGQGQLGDVVERHKKYGEFVDQLDIVVFSKKGFTVHKISENVVSYPTNSASKLKYFFDAIKFGRSLFLKTKYDLIVTQEPFITGLVGVKLKKKFGAKLLVHLHGDFGGWKLFLAKFFILSQADAVRVMSAGQKEKLGKYQNKATVISTPVDLEKYKRSFFQENVNTKVVMHVGRDDKVKDYDTLIKAFELVNQKLPDVKFVKVLGGREFKKSVDGQPGRKFNLIVHSQVDHKSLVDFYYQTDVVVLSSTSESFGKVLVEANACGKPVVSTATTGAKEIVQDGYNGYLVPIGDAQALADKILYLLNNPKIAKTMGENGRKLVKEKYNDNTQKIINLWRELVR